MAVPRHRNSDDASLPPPPDIVRSAYAELIVTNLAEARHFWVDLLGFVVTDEDSESLYLRGYDELTHHNLVLPAGRGDARGRRDRAGGRPAGFHGGVLRLIRAPGAPAAALRPAPRRRGRAA